MSAPILFLIFNRPDLTAKTFAQIREARPPQLFIAADGPRPDRQDEQALCEECRNIAQSADWPCEVHTLFREQNLGCGKAVSSAITWFFGQVEAGIILEDDCIPNPSFFPYCTELLDRYKDEPKVMTITGSRFDDVNAHGLENSYGFSIYHHIWGWATWRRAWSLCKQTISETAVVLNEDKLDALLQNKALSAHWVKIAQQFKQGLINTWDYPWLFSCWEHAGLSIRPETNLISNQGFDERATHTKKTVLQVDSLPVNPISFPLRHPPVVSRNKGLELESVKLFIPQKPLVAPLPEQTVSRNIALNIFSKSKNFLNCNVNSNTFIARIRESRSLKKERKKALSHFQKTTEHGLVGSEFSTNAIPFSKRLQKPNGKNMRCQLCEAEAGLLFNQEVLGKYQVDYFHCQKCESVFTEKAYWLNEAYNHAISDMDTGILVRNLSFSEFLTPFIHTLLPEGAAALDVSGGYGIFARLMRDKGFQYYSTDPYCENLFTRGFEPAPNLKPSLLTLFEVLEHLEDPVNDLLKMIDTHEAKHLILSTQTYAGEPPDKDWWYYMFESGQHVRFHSHQSLDFLAKRLDMQWLHLGKSLHLFTSLPISSDIRNLLCNGPRKQRYLQRISKEREGKSLTLSDMNELKSRKVKRS